MFSEYASRFLAQSQSRIGSRPDEPRRNRGQGPLRNQGVSRLPSRSFLQRNADPYQPTASQISNFPFASRAAQPAPLFYSATDEFREEDDEAEHEREISDFYALQKSRRHFGGSQLKDSSEMDEEDEGSTSNIDNQQDSHDDGLSRGKGIKSSWRGGKASRVAHNIIAEPVSEAFENEYDSHISESSSRNRGKLVDIGLDDTLRSGLEDGRQADLNDDTPPSIQRFRDSPQRNSTAGMDSFFVPTEAQKQNLLEKPQPPSSVGSDPASFAPNMAEPPSHDAFWGHLFLLSVAGLFATAFLVYLHTSAPSGDKSKWGDTIYLTLHGSFYLLGVYTLVSIFVSLLWLALLRSYMRPLAYLMIIAVPIILYSFSLYPFISSFKGSWHGASVQDRVMRYGSIVPFVMASLWIYNVIRGRHAIGKAVSILEFACRILAANPELLALGLGVLACIVSWTWVWTLMFTRVFLGGHISGQRSFIIDISSWWLGIYFIIVYLWSLGVIAGFQRAVTAATVSQWYFHRLATPAPTSRQIVQAAVVHALTTLFGTICLSRFLTLLVRLPLLLLPSRLTSLLSLFAYSFVPTPITTLTNPLTLTYSAIHSQPLAVSARGLGQMTQLSPWAATSSIHPRSFPKSRQETPLLSYRVSKLLLHAARLMMSLALGFGGWVTTARNLVTPGVVGSIRGSVYAYVVGLIAAAIGWSVLGAIEGVIADIVDATVVCWSSEVGTYGNEARYCREAGWLFSDDALSESRYARRQEV